MDSGWMAVWPVAAFFLGGIATHLTAWLTHRRQQLERQQDAARALHDRRESFELDHLQKLNDALQVLARTAARMHHADMLASRESGRYGSTPVSEELSEENRVASQEVRMLRGLVLDDELREQVHLAQRTINALGWTAFSDPTEATAAFMASITQLNEAQDRIAARTREIYLASTAGRPPALPA
ncbi:hypothetical protein [Streptomyces parvus]|uniref:hypothetical protein n=1 Tax=Streptomyces parvus TaxID=66428 RepID=UPI00332322AF